MCVGMSWASMFVNISREHATHTHTHTHHLLFPSLLREKKKEQDREELWKQLDRLKLEFDTKLGRQSPVVQSTSQAPGTGVPSVGPSQQKTS